MGPSRGQFGVRLATFPVSGQVRYGTATHESCGMSASASKWQPRPPTRRPPWWPPVASCRRPQSAKRQRFVELQERGGASSPPRVRSAFSAPRATGPRSRPRLSTLGWISGRRTRSWSAQCPTGLLHEPCEWGKCLVPRFVVYRPTISERPLCGWHRLGLSRLKANRSVVTSQVVGIPLAMPRCCTTSRPTATSAWRKAGNPCPD